MRNLTRRVVKAIAAYYAHADINSYRAQRINTRMRRNYINRQQHPAASELNIQTRRRYLQHTRGDVA